MRATTVTMGLGFTALVAVAIAPRLMGRVDRAEVVVVPVPVAPLSVVALPVDEPESFEPESFEPDSVEPMAVAPVRPVIPRRVEPVVAEALPMRGGRGAPPDTLIPELDARPNHRTPPVRHHVRVEPPPEPIEPIGWDCPACGMG